MKNNNHNPKSTANTKGEDTKSKAEKQFKPLNLMADVTTPNTLVPFERCIRVQRDYFMEYDEELIPVTKDILSTDYGRDSIFRIRKYAKFVSIPEHINYKTDHGRNGNNYNLYRPLKHQEKEGSFKHIEAILKHLFRGKHYEMILTYFWVLYMRPRHPLPLLGLVSNGKGTGKTTFLQLVKVIFGGNAKFIDPSDLSANFNSSYIDKLCILIDEKFGSKDKRNDLQKLKKLITGGVQSRKQKHVSDVDVQFYGKFIMCSNDDQGMISIEEENTRFWIVDIQSFENVNYDILEQAIKEIPAFLYYLHHKYKKPPRQGRLWLSTESIQTSRGKVLQENSRSSLAKEIIENLSNYFVEHPNENDVKFSSHQLKYAFDMKDTTENYISRVLKNELRKTTKIEVIRNPFGQGDIRMTRCRCYTFTRDEIIKDEETN